MEALALIIPDGGEGGLFCYEENRTTFFLIFFAKDQIRDLLMERFRGCYTDEHFTETLEWIAKDSMPETSDHASVIISGKVAELFTEFARGCTLPLDVSSQAVAHKTRHYIQVFSEPLGSPSSSAMCMMVVGNESCVVHVVFSTSAAKRLLQTHESVIDRERRVKIFKDLLVSTMPTECETKNITLPNWASLVLINGLWKVAIVHETRGSLAN